MSRNVLISLFLVVALSSISFAGFGSSYSNPMSGDNVVAPIQITEKGIYNLVVSIQFLNEPYENDTYESDEYEKFIQRLRVEWRGVAIQQILEAKEQSINELTGLKLNIEKELLALAAKLKNKYSITQNAEVVFSISSFFLLRPERNN